MPPISSLPPIMVCGVGDRLVTLLSLSAFVTYPGIALNRFIREAEKIRKSGKDMMLLPLQLTAAIVNLLLVLMFDATLQSWVFETKG
ncbi:hypothetical protein Tco_0161649 [Tanacetum coccineum]